MPRLTDEQRNLRDLTEREFQKAYVAALRSLGFFVAHHYDSRFSDPGTKGLPDLTIVGHGMFWMVELKREKGVLHDEQHKWIDALQWSDTVVFVHRPSDWEAMMSYAEAISKLEVAPELRQLPVHKVKKKRRVKPSSE